MRARGLRRSITQGTRELGQLLYGSYERTVHHELKKLGAGKRVTLSQLGLLPRILTHYERRTALALFLLGLVSLSLISWRWYDHHTVVVPSVGGEYAEGIVGLPRTANPLLATSDAARDLAYLTHRGLFRHDSGTPQPDLAESWEISPDKKTYRVVLRPNLRWSDGEQITPDDVVFTFDSLKSSDLKSPLAPSFSGITTQRVDDRTISFTLPEPYAPFLSALTLGIIPSHIWQSIPVTNWRDDSASLNPIGTGPFRFKSSTYDRQNILKSITLEPNPYSHLAAPYLTKIVLKFYPDSTSALTGLREGSIDGLGGLNHGVLASLSELRYSQYELGLPQYTAVFLNTTSDSPLNSSLVRQALNYSINRYELVQGTLGGNATTTAGPFVLGEMRGAAGAKIVTGDAKRVNELMQQAGYNRADASSPYADKEGKPLTITLTLLNSEEQAVVANALKQQWAAAGITVNLELVPPEQMQMEVIPERRYEALLAREIIGFDPDPYPFWHSSQAGDAGLNLSNFKHHEADKLLESARRESDWSKRVEQYATFQNILNDESPAVFLYSVGYTYVVSRAMNPATPAAIAEPADRLRNLSSWYRTTERSFKW